MITICVISICFRTIFFARVEDVIENFKSICRRQILYLATSNRTNPIVNIYSVLSDYLISAIINIHFKKYQ